MNINEEANIIACAEEIKQTSPHICELIKHMFDEYKKQGFDNEQALLLCVEYQKLIFNGK